MNATQRPYKPKVSIEDHTHVDKRFALNIEGAVFYADYDDVHHAEVDAVADTVLDILKNHWNSDRYVTAYIKYLKEEWKDFDPQEKVDEYDGDVDNYIRQFIGDYTA